MVARRNETHLIDHHKHEKRYENPPQHQFRQPRQQPTADLPADKHAAKQQRRGEPVDVPAGRVRNDAGNGGRHDRQRGRGGRVALRQAEPDERGHDHRAAADAERARQHAHQQPDDDQHDNAARRSVERSFARLHFLRLHFLRFCLRFGYLRFRQAGFVRPHFRPRTVPLRFRAFHAFRAFRALNRIFRIASRIHFGHPAPNFIPHIGLLHGPILPTNRMPSPAEFHNPSDAAPSTRTTSHRPYPLLLTIATKSAESQVVSKKGCKKRPKPPKTA